MLGNNQSVVKSQNYEAELAEREANNELRKRTQKRQSEEIEDLSIPPQLLQLTCHFRTISPGVLEPGDFTTCRQCTTRIIVKDGIQWTGRNSSPCPKARTKVKSMCLWSALYCNACTLSDTTPRPISKGVEARNSPPSGTDKS